MALYHIQHKEEFLDIKNYYVLANTIEDAFLKGTAVVLAKRDDNENNIRIEVKCLGELIE